MAKWYLSYDGKRVGPLDEGQAMSEAAKHPEGLAWREGFAKWVPISAVPELTVRQEPPPPVAEDTTSEPQEIYQSTKIRFPKPAQGVSDVIDYKIFGTRNAIRGNRIGSGRKRRRRSGRHDVQGQRRANADPVR